MEKEQNLAAAGGIEVEESVEELRAKLAESEKNLAAANAKLAAQLEDRHAKPGTANESNASSIERWAIVVEEGRDENEINPVYIGVNGRGYSMKRGEVVEVPREVLSVLDTAVELRATPVADTNGVASGFKTREARRFPYRNLGKIVDSNGQRLKVNLPEAGTL